MAKKLNEAGARAMGISLDSLDPKKHDKFRSFPGGWEGAVLGMKNCAAVGLPFHIFHHNVVDLSQGGGVFQHLPGDDGVKMDLDQLLVPNG